MVLFHLLNTDIFLVYPRAWRLKPKRLMPLSPGQKQTERTELGIHK